MNNDRMQGNWKEIKGKVKETWGKLTDNDLTVIDGKRDQLLGKIQERYGMAREEAEKQLKQFEGQHVHEAHAGHSETSTTRR
jgi:uncharacterized protein YjbJ (UPF0337 family)